MPVEGETRTPAIPTVLPHVRQVLRRCAWAMVGILGALTGMAMELRANRG